MKNTALHTYLFTLLLLLGSLSVYADDVLTATLQHNGQMTPFFGDSAFRYANNAAVDGDTIILSRGKFYPDTIRHSVRVLGVYGCDRHLNYYDKTSFISPSYGGVNVYVFADNVFFEGISFDLCHLYLTDINNFVLRRCFALLETTYSTQAHTNTLVDQCVLEQEGAIKKGVNYTIKNSAIERFSAMNTINNTATITNCYIDWFYRNAETTSFICQPYAIYTNCVLGLDAFTKGAPEYQMSGLPEYQFTAPSEYHYNYIYRINSYSVSEYFVPSSFAPGCADDHNQANCDTASAVRCADHPYDNTPLCYANFSWGYDFVPPMTGSDGTPVGITGGTGFSTTPGIPVVSIGWAVRKSDRNGLLTKNINLKACPENPEDNPSVVQFEYWIDDPYGQSQIIPIEEQPGANVWLAYSYTFDLSELSAGEHKLYFRAKDSYGAYSPLYVETIYRYNPYDDYLLLPYDADTLTHDMQIANPTYMAYPTEIEPIMPTIQCND